MSTLPVGSFRASDPDARQRACPSPHALLLIAQSHATQEQILPSQASPGPDDTLKLGIPPAQIRPLARRRARVPHNLFFLLIS